MKAKAPDVPNARLWCATHDDAPASKMLFIEAERFYDARALARRMLGGEPTVVALVGARKLPAPRVQLRWAGSAALRVPDLRAQVREVDRRGRAGEWRDF